MAAIALMSTLLSTSARLDAQTPPSALEQGCQESRACRVYGQCTWTGSDCIAVADDCRAAEVCEQGRCTAESGRCVVGSSADCTHTAGCEQGGRCFRYEDECRTMPILESGAGPTSERDRSVTLAHAGMGLVIAGFVVAAIGGALFASGASGDVGVGSDGASVGVDAAPIGGFLLAVGGASVLTGAILWPIGEANVPVERYRVIEHR